MNSFNDELTSTEIERYRRQVMIDGFGIDAQRKLKSATVLVAGVGGLGGTTALYLAVAGVGKLVLTHYGNLTLSNMNRQVLMQHDKIGTNRCKCAKEKLEAINPDLEILTFPERMDDLNTGRMLEGVDVAVSTRPNFEERRALNAACVSSNIPMVEAAMNGMEGYLTTFEAGRTPCLNCLYPEDPEWEELGFPVLGAVSGTVGTLAAIEVIKQITGYGKPLHSRLLLFNTIDMSFRTVNIYNEPRCSVCGTKKNQANAAGYQSLQKAFTFKINSEKAGRKVLQVSSS